MQPLDLLRLDDHAFLAHVERELVGRCSADVALTLRHPDVLSRWSCALDRLRIAVVAEREARDAEVAASAALLDTEHPPHDTATHAVTLATFHRWAADALRRRGLLDDRRREVAYLRETEAAAREQRRVNERLAALSVRVGELEGAIAEHRQRVHPDDAGRPDHDLWAVLDGTAAARVTPGRRDDTPGATDAA